MAGAAMLTAAQAAGGPRNCDDPQTQAEMNLCASTDFERADDALNRLWPEVIEAVRRADMAFGPAADGRVSGETRLREAQRAWITFRDAHCIAVGYGARGGSLEPMLFNGCRARVTRERTDQLRSDLLSR
ncbi:lysozyme inhibitor LprI family protein [Sphingosinicella sp. CPCC 101087]|uniref:lysozyme inhibitor LprI family protein n=1 Tax=Sphingosinicella sp. CPCC 101087 TaxID=2497754 RepID=UPI001982275D|nr:lysozyme inhibitor LprI family protein [Sphingosinicella sp. CPCC 101087]